MYTVSLRLQSQNRDFFKIFVIVSLFFDLGTLFASPRIFFRHPKNLDIPRKLALCTEVLLGTVSSILVPEIFLNMSHITCIPPVFAVTACKKTPLAPLKKLAPKCQALLDRTNFELPSQTFRYNGCQHTASPLKKGAPYPIKEEPIPCPHQPRLRSGLTIPHTANPSSGFPRRSEKAGSLSAPSFSASPASCKTSCRPKPALASLSTWCSQCSPSLGIIPSP